MTSWVAWAVLVVAAALLGFVGYHFSVRTLRIAAAGIAVALVVFITGYGLAHPAGAPADLAGSFTRGADELSAVVFRVLRLGHRVPAPGRVGWLVIVVALVIGYRMLEAWALHWQAPVLDTSKLGESPPDSKPDAGRDGPAGQIGGGPHYAQLAAELRFRLAAMEVRAPSILPGGSRSNGLASIAEASGVTGSGLAGAIIRFFGMLWPSPRRFQLRLWVEATPAGGGPRVTVDLEDPRTGGTIVTRTVAAGSPAEAASMVAGYVARQVFAADPGTPPWCVGTPDGLELVRRLRTDPPTADELRKAKDDLLNSFIFRYDSKDKVLAEAATLEFYGYPPDFLEKYRSGVEAVTLADLERVAKKYIDPSKLAVLVVGNESQFGTPLTDLQLGQPQSIDITIPMPAGMRQQMMGGPGN